MQYTRTRRKSEAAYKQIREKQFQQKSIHLHLSKFKNSKEIGTMGKKLIASHKRVSGKMVINTIVLAL